MPCSDLTDLNLAYLLSYQGKAVSISTLASVMTLDSPQVVLLKRKDGKVACLVGKKQKCSQECSTIVVRSYVAEFQQQEQPSVSHSHANSFPSHARPCFPMCPVSRPCCVTSICAPSHCSWQPPGRHGAGGQPDARG